ncbi:uncharacterized protein [Typha angustifolia]|uniref:uncharacterized protein isoform X2 n=1 Tax=Typha angustifolia TaxID=59011 RepID=UPI003C2FC6B1
MIAAALEPTFFYHPFSSLLHCQLFSLVGLLLLLLLLFLSYSFHCKRKHLKKSALLSCTPPKNRKRMPPRAYVLIFFFWAFLAVITPTLIFWSASARPNLDSQGEVRDDFIARRSMNSMENAQVKNRRVVIPPLPAPAPSLIPSQNREENLERI